MKGKGNTYSVRAGNSRQEMDKDLQEWGRLMEKEAVPERLRALATQLREALIAARSANHQPPDQ